MTDEIDFFNIVGTDPVIVYNHYCIDCEVRMERHPEEDMIRYEEDYKCYWCRSCDRIRWYLK
jgi:hypothetical protein